MTVERISHGWYRAKDNRSGSVGFGSTALRAIEDCIASIRKAQEWVKKD